MNNLENTILAHNTHTVIPQFIRGIQVVFLILLLSACSNQGGRDPIPNYMKPEIMIVSVSNDGNYAVTSDLYQHLVLWNLKDHTYKIVAKKANVYGAYFIKNTNNFIYQSNANNNVYVENTDGQIIKTFNPGFASYGEVMTSDLKRYFAADKQFNVYQVENNVRTQIFVPSCMNGMTGTVYKGPLLSACTDFASSGKLLNLTLSPDEKTLIGSDGLGRSLTWDLNNNFKGKKNEVLDQFAFSTPTPDSQYTLTGDLKMQFFKCTIDGTSCQHFFAVPENATNEPENYKGCASGITTIKFIDSTHFLIFYAGMPDCYFPFAALYSMHGKTTYVSGTYYNYYTMNPIYLPLLNSNDPNAPQPLTMNDSQNAFLRDQAIDTSPSAHILVMAQADQNGILVYQYNPATQTLKQTWAPVIPKAPWWKFWDN